MQFFTVKKDPMIFDSQQLAKEVNLSRLLPLRQHIDACEQMGYDQIEIDHPQHSFLIVP